ncbi:unnamed protein product [Orchesella dallaii]|uniref:Uncharacterized protein n=1 Tax=Orchesella dallaii TaxID=48710 RepID=A0ABP1RNS4_9HEXA
METSSPSFLAFSGEKNEDEDSENSINEANAADVENSSQERLQVESPVGESQDKTLNDGEEGQSSAKSNSDIRIYLTTNLWILCTGPYLFLVRVKAVDK